jgi:predicted MPP superfamily phosphohydrolase
MLGWELLYRFNVCLANKVWFRALAWIGSTLLGVWVTFILFSLVVDAIYLALLAITTLTHTTLLTSLFYWTNIIIFVISLLLAGFGLKTALSGPKIIEIFIPIENKPSVLQKLKIVQISDLHIGAIIRHDYVEKVVLQVNGLKPDLIALTGDVADGIPHDLIDQLQPLTKLHAPLGKFFVTGNHEYYWGAKQWVNAMSKLGFTPLINENQVIHFADMRILVAGVTDVYADKFLTAHKTDLQKAILSDKPSDFRILLSHNPRTFTDAKKIGFDLQLSGHTHAGQFFPFSLLVPLAHKYYSGLNQQNKAWLYINSGTGSWGPINRFGVHAEITLIRFKSTHYISPGATA